MDSGQALQGLIVIGLLALSAFFSSAETAMMTVNKIRVRNLAEAGLSHAVVLEKILSNQPKMLSAILIGNNIVNISASSLMTVLVTDVLGNKYVGIGTGVLTLLVLIFGEITTGASNDIEQATKFARAMITRYGMNEEFDMVAMESVSNQYLGGDSSLTCSTETQTLIDQKVVQLVKEQHQKAKKILEDNVMKLHEIAKFLYEHETITGEEFMEILNSDSQKIIEEKQQ